MTEGDAGDFDLPLGVGDHALQGVGVAVQAFKSKGVLIAHPDRARADGDSGDALIRLILHDHTQSNAITCCAGDPAISDKDHPRKLHR